MEAPADMRKQTLRLTLALGLGAAALSPLASTPASAQVVVVPVHHHHYRHHHYYHHHPHHRWHR